MFDCILKPPHVLDICLRSFSKRGTEMRTIFAGLLLFAVSGMYEYMGIPKRFADLLEHECGNV